MTDKIYQTKKTWGGYRNLRSYQMATVIYDFTVEFCRTYMTYMSHGRTIDQMVQAARSGRQNIAEGSQASATSKKTEIKLVGVARASLEELLIDYEDFLRQKGLNLWEKEEIEAKEIRQLVYRTDTSYQTYRTYFKSEEKAANCAICLIHQASYLLDRQLQALERAFLEEGGYTENLFKRRVANRSQK